MSELVAPPADVKPGALFLDLATWPYPRRPIAFRFREAQDTPLYVRAIHPQVRARAAVLGDYSPIVAASLTDGSGAPIFASAEDVGNLVDASEMMGLVLAIRDALNVIGPTLDRIDDTRWRLVLAQGAKEVPGVAYAMASCSDVTVGWGGVVKRPRPDRYYGAPMRELLDGHLMAFYAGYEHFNKDR